MSTPLLELHAGDEPAAWARLGFAVDTEGTCRIGSVALHLDGTGGGLKAWTLGGPPGPEEIDGLATRWALDHRSADAGVAAHENGATAIDHLVVFTGDRERTARALIEVGGDLRRRRDPPSVPAPMAFLRFGETIVEIAQQGHAAARFWGLVAVVRDVDLLGERYGALLGTPRAAIQPGRRIVTAPRGDGRDVPLAFMTPRR